MDLEMESARLGNDLRRPLASAGGRATTPAGAGPPP